MILNVKTETDFKTVSVFLLTRSYLEYFKSKVELNI